LRGRAKGIHVVMHAFRVVFVLLLLVGAIPWFAAAESSTQLYIGHRARLTAEIPADWAIPDFAGGDYKGDSGFVISQALSGDGLVEACDRVTTGGYIQQIAVKDVTWHGEDACQFEGTFDGSAAVGLVIPHLHPFSSGGEVFAFVLVLTDPDHFTEITDSISFDPEHVTPQLYLDSVLDLVEARAWYAGDVNWARFRTNAEPLVQNADTLEETHWVIKDALTNLGYWGDNHSGFIEDLAQLTVTRQQGLGIILENRVVRIVYPDSPAGRAGVRVGDTVVAVDGLGFNGTRQIQTGPGGLVTLSIVRHGVSQPVMVEIESGPFNLYLPPIVEQTSDGMGYIELFTTYGADPIQYVADGHEGIDRVDEAGACGWIVDVRRNAGGGYPPMVAGVGPLLGDGPILQMETREGRVRMSIDYRDGNFYRNGVDTLNVVSTLPLPKLNAPQPPVAILIGPGTVSAGEDAAIAFIGRPDVRFFGEPSGGYTVGNSGYSLYDGAFLILADSAITDRNSDTYIGGIEPDEIVRTDWTIYGTADDPVIQAATEWLEQQPGCAQATLVATTPEAG